MILIYRLCKHFSNSKQIPIPILCVPIIFVSDRLYVQLIVPESLFVVGRTKTAGPNWRGRTDPSP
jgi:hypothetical protein